MEAPGQEQDRDAGEIAGEWCSVAEAARRFGVSRRAIRDRVERGTLSTRQGNRGREVFVATGVLPSAGRQEGSGVGQVPGRIALPGGPAVLPAGYVERLADELAAERRVREAAERDAAVARREVELVRETARREVELVREVLAVAERDRDRLVRELEDARRPWVARWLDALRARRPG